MSNDLISRSALLEDFRNTITERSDTFDWLNMINRQPTAYDVGKVKERLNKLKEIYPTGNGNYEYAVRVDKAIEAVEAGGLNE